jgi:hypothetical protein
VGLTGPFSVPFDLEDAVHDLYGLHLGPGGGSWSARAWHGLERQWGELTWRCAVTADGQDVTRVPLRRQILGVCSLRLRRLAETADPAGWWVVAARVGVW